MAEPNTSIPDGELLVDAQTPQQDVAAAATNGTANGSMDVEMKEEPTDSTAPSADIPPATSLAAPSTDGGANNGGSTPQPVGTSTPPPFSATATPVPTGAPVAATPAAAAPSTGTTPTAAARTGSPRPPTGATTPSAAAAAQQQQQQLPAQPNPHGSTTRVYLNQNVTPHLLEGMKKLALLEPEKPLKWLSDFLAEKSREHERD